MLGPSLAAWILFVFVPLGVAAYQSLFSWDMLTDPEWVGAANYAAIAENGELLRIFGRTLGFSVLVVAGSMSLGLLLALLLDRPGNSSRSFEDRSSALTSSPGLPLRSFGCSFSIPIAGSLLGPSACFICHVSAFSPILVPRCRRSRRSRCGRSPGTR